MERGCLIGADRVACEMGCPPVGEFELLIESVGPHYDIFFLIPRPKYPRIAAAGTSAGDTAKTPQCQKRENARNAKKNPLHRRRPGNRGADRRGTGGAWLRRPRRP